MHEIVTLQFGQQANYLGTHFWNTQESYFTYSPTDPDSPVNHDILFKPGLAPDGSDTFTPRTLIYDLKGAFGPMKKISPLYEPPSDTPDLETPGLWPSKPIVSRKPPIPLSKYQASLDAGVEVLEPRTEEVRFWSDYSNLYYHPKSLVQLSEFEVGDRLMPFEQWEVGQDLFEKLEREGDLVDRDFRPFVEECDGLQGVQIFTGVGDAWGGWAAGWLERLRDEYGKIGIWTVGVGEQGTNSMVPREKRLQQIANSARSLSVLGEQSSVYIPLTNHPAKVPPYLRMDVASPWHTGALQCMAYETLTMPSRLRSSESGHSTLQELEQTINQTGQRRLAKLGISVTDPDMLREQKASKDGQPGKKGASREDSEDAEDGLPKFDIDHFTQDYHIGPKAARKKEHIFGRVESIRGEWDVKPVANPRDRFHEGPTVQRYNTPLLFPKLSSYPSIFSVSPSHADKLAVHSGLTTSTAVAEQIRTLERIAGRVVSLDEREALCNGLQTLAEEYDEGWDSGSDSDFDD